MKMEKKILNSPLISATQHLTQADPDWARIIAQIGPCGLQSKSEREPYEALIRAIAHQQLHGRAAEAITARFLALYPDVAFPDPASILATDENVLRGCGFSATKVTTILGIAEQARNGLIPKRQDSLTMTDEELIERLTTLRGVGRWTVQMLLIFTLDRLDVLPVDDFGVREGWRVMKQLAVQPRPKELEKTGLAWSPHRSVAAWYLWQVANQAKLAVKTENFQVVKPG